MRFTLALLILFFSLSPAVAQPSGASKAEGFSLAHVPIGVPENGKVQNYKPERTQIDDTIEKACKDSGRYRWIAAPKDLDFYRKFEPGDVFCDITNNYSKCMIEVGGAVKEGKIPVDKVLWGWLGKTEKHWNIDIFVLDRLSSEIGEGHLQKSFPATEGGFRDLLRGVKSFISGQEAQEKQYDIRIMTTPGAKILINDKVVGKAGANGLPVRLPKGDFEVKALLGKDTVKKTIVMPYRRPSVTLTFKKDQSKSVTKSRLAPEKKFTWRFWTGIGAMTVAAGSGVTSMLYLAKRERSHSAGTDLVNMANDFQNGRFTVSQREEFDRHKADFDSQQTVFILSASVAGIAAVTGAYLLFLSDTTETSSTAVIPTLGGLTIQSRF